MSYLPCGLPKEIRKKRIWWTLKKLGPISQNIYEFY